MESASGLKQAEAKISLTADKVSTYLARLDDLVFRAQRIAAAIQKKQKIADTSFEYELQNFRKEMKSFNLEVSSLPAALASLERGDYETSHEKMALSLYRCSQKLAKGITALHDRALLAYNHMKLQEHRMAAWYMTQEIEEMTQKARGIPDHVSRIVSRITSLASPSQPPPVPNEHEGG